MAITLAGMDGQRRPLGPAERLRRLHWPFVALVCVIAAIGVGLLYSVAGGSLEPWGRAHAWRFAAAIAVLLAAALIDVRLWMRAAVPFYLACLAGLLAVELTGLSGGGATRWIGLGDLQLQPSEFMKLALVLALARYYQAIDARTVSRPTRLVVPAALIALPVALVLRQPDLGTAALLAAGGAVVLLAAGVHWLYFALAALGAAGTVPLVWQGLHGYQKARILTFLDPERDPLGAGYHIIQSKIALGSGGWLGKGYIHGTQSQLNFVPEKHTDFIFIMVGEEFGFVGASAMIALFALVTLLALAMALRAKNRFGRLAGIGISCMLFAYVFVNIAMVAGLVPVVGVPLPLVSYGGTAMMAVMLALGVLLSIHVNRDLALPRPLARRR